MNSLNRHKHTPLWLVIILDILSVGVVLLTFAFFHHVLPAQISEYKLRQLLEQRAQQVYVPTEVNEPTVEEEPEVDERTPWQIKFAEHFTDEVVITDNSYTSPEVSITIETVVEKINRQQVTYYVADVYVASLDNFKSYTAYNEMLVYVAQYPDEMARDSNAIFAISGDYFSFQRNGFIVRNGNVYANNRNNSICVLFPDGVMETYDHGSYKVDDIMARNPLQVWSFGPVLLDAEGKVRDYYYTSDSVAYPNPRAAIGYYEPGHYLMVVVDGRQQHSYGVTIAQLAKIFEDRGCKAAYNLDGGGSAVALFGGQPYSKQSGKRELSDIIIITESGYTPHKKEKS